MPTHSSGLHWGRICLRCAQATAHWWVRRVCNSQGDRRRGWRWHVPFTHRLTFSSSTTCWRPSTRTPAGTSGRRPYATLSMKGARPCYWLRTSYNGCLVGRCLAWQWCATGHCSRVRHTHNWWPTRRCLLRLHKRRVAHATRRRMARSLCRWRCWLWRKRRRRSFACSSSRGTVPRRRQRTKRPRQRVSPHPQQTRISPQQQLQMQTLLLPGRERRRTSMDLPSHRSSDCCALRCGNTAAEKWTRSW
mmetsp:Transcript_34284/g.85419  ORF Transcript_34284/g.85419 Transcript_34284/m.85419 type:complete len:247 (-) Transcript_34284:2262-3002(-)